MAQFHFIGGDGKTYGPYSREQMQQFMAENRVNAQSQVSADGGAWQPAGQHPELAASTGTPPVPANLGAPAAPGMPQPMMAANPAAAQQMVNGPAIFMMILAITMILLQLLGAVLNLAGGAIAADLPPEIRDKILAQGALGLVQNAVIIIVNIIILIGSIKMKKCQSHGLAMAASILCILCDWGCCCLGIGAGIWGIVVLSKPEVKAVFR